MKIHFFDKLNEDSTKNFGGSTIMAMCYIPAIIEFDCKEEIKGFRNVWEDIAAKIEELSEENQEIFEQFPDNITCWYIDAFEGELFLMEDICKERNLSLVPMVNEPNSSFIEAITVQFGHLNSADITTEFDVLEKHIVLLKNFLDDPIMTKKYSIKQLDMLVKILRLWQTDLELSNDPGKQFFKIDFE